MCSNLPWYENLHIRESEARYQTLHQHTRARTKDPKVLYGSHLEGTPAESTRREVVHSCTRIDRASQDMMQKI
jgi:hypothetical protein